MLVCLSRKKLGVESVVIQTVKNLPAVQETRHQSPGQEDLLDKGIATHSTILAWRIQGTEELVGYSPWWGVEGGYKELDRTEWLTVHTLIFREKLVSLFWFRFPLVPYKNHLNNDKESQGALFMKTNINQAWPFPEGLCLQGAAPWSWLPASCGEGCLSLLHLNWDAKFIPQGLQWALFILRPFLCCRKEQKVQKRTYKIKFLWLRQQNVYIGVGVGVV